MNLDLFPRPWIFRWRARQCVNQRRLFYLFATMDEAMTAYPICHAIKVRANFVQPRLWRYLDRGLLRAEWRDGRRYYYPSPEGRKYFIDRVGK